MIERKTAHDWKPENVRRLWTYWNSRPHLRAENFSYQVGRGVVNFLDSTGRLKGKALDYGCGLGFLLEHMLGRGLVCSGIEFSQESIDLVNEKFRSDPNWAGAQLVNELPAPFPPAEFDVITCTETLEHLSDELLPAVVSEIHRLLKPGGVALFTTPNDEDLEQAMAYCPFCEAEFHKVQHQRSFTHNSMTRLLESEGFEVLFCRNVNFAEFQNNVSLRAYDQISIQLLRQWLAGRKDRYLDRISPRQFPDSRDFKRRAMPGPHLAAVVTRSP